VKIVDYQKTDVALVSYAYAGAEVYRVRKMTDKLKKGDHVEWNSSGGKTEGVIEEKITKPTDFKGHHFDASKDDPEYRVKSDKSGKDAIHKPESLKKKD
jgi:hypothetical protein